MTVNESVAPLKRLGYVEVRGLGSTTTPEEEEARKRSYYLSLARPRQAAFRDTLLAAYEQRCVVTGCSVVQALEAAHVQPFEAGGIDALSNGLLLRVDLHRLFDAGYIAIEPDSFEVRISSKIGSDYKDIDGTRILIPKGGPSSDQLRPRWLEFVTG